MSELKPEAQFTEQERKLYDLMSEISEDCWCAGWMAGNEFALWDALTTGVLTYGQGEIDRALLAQVAALSVETGKWIIWRDKEDGLAPAEWGAYAISLADWACRRAASPSPASDAELPPLPPAFMDLLSPTVRKAWADQMRAYGQECARAASTRTASDTRTAAGEAVTWRRVDWDSGKWIFTDERPTEEIAWEGLCVAGEAECDAALGRAAPALLTPERIKQLWHASGCAVSVDTAEMKFHFARSIEQELASRCGAQGRITQAETRMDTGSCGGAHVDVEAERPRFESAFAGATFQRNPSGCPCDYVFEATENLWQGWLAARTQADAGQDKALLDYLDKWVICNEKQGFKWFTFAFDTNKTAREQIKAEMDLAATKPENT